MKKLIFLISVLSASSAVAGNPKTISDLTVQNSTITINGLQYGFPLAAVSTASTVMVRDSAGNVTLQTAVTDAGRRGGTNTFTSSNTFNNYPLVLEELGSIPCPPAGKRAFGAKSDGFYQKDSSCGESMVGTGSSSGSGAGWGLSGNILSSTNTVLIGTTTSTTANSSTLLQVARGPDVKLDINSSSSVFRNVSTFTISGIESMSLANAGQWTLSNTHFDLSVATFTPPSYSSNPGFIAGQVWLNTSSNTIYSGDTPISNSSGGGGGGGGTSAPYSAWNYASAIKVAYSTEPVVIGTTVASVPTGTLFQVSTSNVHLFGITTSSITISQVGAVRHTGVSTFTVTDAALLTQVQRIIISTTMAVLSSNQNDYVIPGNYEIYRTSASTSVDITGLSGGTADRFIYVVNVGTTTITLKNDDAGSSAQNRFYMNADASLGQGQGTRLWYDTILQRWLNP